MNETKPKRMVSRNVAIALGIICILLIAIIAYFSITGISAQNSYNTLQNQNKQLSANNTNLQSQINNLTDFVEIAHLAKYAGWISDLTISQPASSYTAYNFSADWAGFVEVWVQNSSVASINVKVVYTTAAAIGDWNFNQEIVVINGTSAEFPILPSSNIQIEVGNGNLINGATETVSIIYYY